MCGFKEKYVVLSKFVQSKTRNPEGERLKGLLKFFAQIGANPLEVRRWLVARRELRVEMNEPYEKAIGRSLLRSTLVDQRAQRLDRRSLAQKSD